MRELDKAQEHFLGYWFSGFMKGLEQVDEKAQHVILKTCGLACARSYTVEVFRQAKEKSNDLDSFLEKLAKRFPEAEYKRIDEATIEVSYQECACDLVKNGWIQSALLCKCSVYNLERNFKEALEKPVQVKLKSSILAGAEQCLFEVVFLG